MIQKLAAAVLCFLFVLTAQAQGSSLTYGQTVTGSIAKAGAPADYTFAGAVDDVVTVRVIPTASTLTPALTLIGPDGSQLDTAATGALTRRLSAVGTYTIVVTGDGDTTGDFTLRLDGGADNPTTLNIGQVLSIDLAANAPPRLFRVEQTSNQQSLTLTADDPTFRFQAQLIDRQGEVVEAYTNDTPPTVIILHTGSGFYEISLSAVDPAQTGVVLLDLERGAPASFAPTSAVTPTALPPPSGRFSATSAPTPPPMSAASLRAIRLRWIG